MVPVTRSVRRGIRAYRGPEPSFVNHVCRYGASLDGWLSSANSSRAAIPLGFSLPPRSAHHEISILLPAFGTALPGGPTRPPVLSSPGANEVSAVGAAALSRVQHVPN